MSAPILATTVRMTAPSGLGATGDAQPGDMGQAGGMPTR
jgi:hypothetical protein